MSHAPVTLNEWDARLILEALRALDEKWTGIIRSSTNEDEQADYGNDLALLDMTRERIEQAVCPVFGPGIKDFSRAPLYIEKS